jgi:hypothetical protein
MSTNSRTWKKAEARVAALIGARRQVLSGSSGRDDRTQSDSTHSRIFIEVKYRQRHAVRSLFDETKAKARKEDKTPVVALLDKGRPGCLVCVHSGDLPLLVAEFTLANTDIVEQAIRRARPERPEDPAPLADEAAA